MKRSIILFCSTIFIAFNISCSTHRVESNAVVQTSVNPVLPGDRPDPTVIKIGDTYWASATSNEWSPLFPIFKSKNLVDWELVSYVFPKGAPEWALNNFWAPELAYDERQKKVYVYYTARDKQSNRLSVAVASAESPAGPYKDHGPLVAQQYGSIDAYEVKDLDNKVYVVWKEDGNSKGQPTPIWAQEINEGRTALLGEKHELFRNDKDWEGNLVEGACIFRRNDYFYATYSAGGCCETSCSYKTGVARAKNLLGPWEKYEKNPILVNNEDWKCPGHGTVVERGKDLYFLYHAYNTEGSVFVGREGVLEKFEWTPDGWPTLKNNASYNRMKESINFVDNFKTLNPAWQWRVTQKIDSKTGKDGLMLGASIENKDLGTLLVQQTKSPDYDVSAKINMANSGDDTEGGIALVGAAHNGFGAPIAAMGISSDGEMVKVWETIEGTTKIFASKPAVGDVAEIKIEVEDGQKLKFLYKTASGWQVLHGNQDASHLVPWGMGFRIGLVSKGGAGQYVNFKQVELKNN